MDRAGGDGAGGVAQEAFGLSSLMSCPKRSSGPLLIAYSLLWWLLSPLLGGYLLYRSLQQPAYRRHWGERFGIGLPSFKDEGPPLIWIHAVSLGETRALTSLLPAIANRYPEHRLLLTHGTPTGREAGAELLKPLADAFAETQQCYMPYDQQTAVDRFFECYNPKIGLVIETEVWPMLMARAKAHGVLMLLVSARLSEKSLSKAQQTRRLIEPALNAFDRILCQTENDMQRILQLAPSAKCQVCGNLKFDAKLSEVMIRQGLQWRTVHENDLEIPMDHHGFVDFESQSKSSGPDRQVRRWLLAASTREREEELLLKQWQALHEAGKQGTVLVIVPRHPQRFAEIAQVLEQYCPARWIRRSDSSFPRLGPSIQVVLGDSMGEMAAWYALADVVVMGGSLINSGSQNLIEACAAGKPVILGPSIYNFEQAAKQAIDAGAALQTESSQVLKLALELADQPGRCQTMGENARRFVACHQGATECVISVLKALRSF